MTRTSSTDTRTYRKILLYDIVFYTYENESHSLTGDEKGIDRQREAKR
jgi:hypothetical protein